MNSNKINKNKEDCPCSEWVCKCEINNCKLKIHDSNG